MNLFWIILRLYLRHTVVVFQLDLVYIDSLNHPYLSQDE